MLLDFGPQIAYSLPRQQNRERVGEATSQVEVLPPHLEDRDEHGETRMALKETGLTGRNVQQTCERQTGLLLQPPDSMTQARDGTTLTVIPTTVGTSAAASDINVEFGSPFVIHAGVSIGQAGGGDATFNMRVFGTDGSPFKFRVLSAWGHAQGTDNQDGTLTLVHYTLDSAGAFDTATAMTDGQKMTSNVANGLIKFGVTVDVSTLIEAAAVVDAGDELVVRFLTSDATEAEEISLKILCMRIN